MTPTTAEIVERVQRSTRYRDVDPSLIARLAVEEVPKARNADEAVKRVKRRLHQAVGAFRRHRPATSSWPVGDPSVLRDACIAAMRRHASTRERVPHLDRFHAGIWERTGVPASVLDLGCGLHPLALPWMGLGPARYVAMDADAGTLSTVGGFLEAMGQPHRTVVGDLVRQVPDDPVDVVLLLKLVTTLDRQDPEAAGRLLRMLRARHAVVSFASRSLGGRGGRERTYRDRLDRLATDSGRVVGLAEASVPNELVFALTLGPRPIDG